MLTRLFELDARRTTVAREIRGAIATFLTMAYILFANPGILAAAGVPYEGAVAATAAALSCFAMGLLANAPIALAPGMGLNAVVAYQIAASPVRGRRPWRWSSSKDSSCSRWCSSGCAKP